MDDYRNSPTIKFCADLFPAHRSPSAINIGARAGGARGAAAPPKFRQLRFFGQQEKIWAKPVFKDVSMFLLLV